MVRNICFACCGVILGMAIIARIDLLEEVSAQGQVKCDFSFISDNGEPNIGKAGEIRYGDEWKAMVDGGWSLKTTADGDGGYIFERCR